MKQETDLQDDTVYSECHSVFSVLPVDKPNATIRSISCVLIIPLLICKPFNLLTLSNVRSVQDPHFEFHKNYKIISIWFGLECHTIITGSCLHLIVTLMMHLVCCYLSALIDCLNSGEWGVTVCFALMDTISECNSVQSRQQRRHKHMEKWKKYSKITKAFTLIGQWLK